MTIVYGQIESLTQIKNTLQAEGIDRFNSLGDIKKFKTQYEAERKNLSNKVEQEVNKEIEGLKADITKCQNYFDNLKGEEIKLLNAKIATQKLKHNFLNVLKTTNVFSEMYYWFFIWILTFRIAILKKHFNTIINLKTLSAKNRLKSANNILEQYNSKIEQIIMQRSAPKLKKLTHIKEVIDNMYPLIAGAVGESLVEKELKKLTGNNILFNDFAMRFKPPIYNRKENDRIYSIQIDHLLVTKAGLFIIETKNWSQESIEDSYLRSPIEQINRTNFALFVLLNSDSNHGNIGLNRHHWGQKKLPIRNIIVMIHGKLKDEFKYVQIKTLKELNGYISYFEPIFDDDEVIIISEYLKQLYY